MSRKSRTVAELAKEASVDIDEILVTLWDLRYESALTADDNVPGRYVNALRSRLRVASKGNLRSVNYWKELLGLESEQFSALLGELNVHTSTNSLRLSRGAVSRLMAYGYSVGINPFTGKIHSKSPSNPIASCVAKHERSEEESNKHIMAPWVPIGHDHKIVLLTETEVESIHFELVSDYENSVDPIDPPGIRDINLFGSAVYRPNTSIGGELKYPTIESSASALLHALILDHPFHNGNKRTALVATLSFLDRNGIFVLCDERELFRIVLRIAQHRMCESRDPDEEMMAINKWICENTRLVEKGEHPIPWRRLRQILTSYQCQLFNIGGNRINIVRQITTKSKFNKARNDEKKTQVYYRNEGSEAEVNTIAKIREDLLLDEKHGIDSIDFYRSSPGITSEFIVKYRSTLDRLSKL